MIITSTIINCSTQMMNWVKTAETFLDTELPSFGVCMQLITRSVSSPKISTVDLNLESPLAVVISPKSFGTLLCHSGWVPPEANTALF